MKFTDIKAELIVKTSPNNQLSSDMQGKWRVVRVDNWSFTISRIDEQHEEHFSRCASINFLAA